MDFAFGSFAGAVNFKAVAAYRTEEKFGEDAAVGVACAEKENAEYLGA